MINLCDKLIIFNNIVLEVFDLLFNILESCDPANPVAYEYWLLDVFMIQSLYLLFHEYVSIINSLVPTNIY